MRLIEQVTGISQRPQQGEDGAFVLELYLSTRWHEFAQIGWPEDAIRGLLVSQSQIQTLQYQSNYPGLERWIILFESDPVGRLYLWQDATELRIVDISLLPQWRNRGIGSVLLDQTFERAQTFGMTLCLHVEQSNPALHLYRRMGFKFVEEKGIYWRLERKI